MCFATTAHAETFPESDDGKWRICMEQRIDMLRMIIKSLENRRILLKNNQLKSKTFNISLSHWKEVQITQKHLMK